MASNNPTQNEKELGTSLEEDLARILGSQVNDEPPHTPKRKEPPAAAESVNSSVPQTISSTDVVNEDEIQSGTGAASTTVNAAGDGPEQFQLSPRPQVGATAIEEAIPRSSDARAIEEAIPRSSADQGGLSQGTQCKCSTQYWRPLRLHRKRRLASRSASDEVFPNNAPA